MGLVDNIILDNLNEFNLSIKDTLISKGINDTNNAAGSLHTVQNGKIYQSVGSDYIEVLDKGRSPGTYAPVDAIQDWVKSKLGIVSSPELEQVAFLINRKIKNEGTAIYKDNSKGLLIDSKIEVLSDNLAKDLRVFAVADVKRRLDMFKNQRI